MKNILTTLQDRGCIHDASHFEDLATLFEKESITFYCGFDPTSDSLHVGSMLPLQIMRRLQDAGHTPIVLIGAATGMIGDPSGKSEERILLDREQIDKNIEGIERQVSLFLSKEGDNAFSIVRNDSWLNKLSYIEFLRDIGKHFSVNQMIAKDSVKERLNNREQGISYTEFSYMLLQAYDFYWLQQNRNCSLQVGGSDQWGNITAGLELIKKKSQSGDSPAFGLTFPLLTTSSGAKFGKTEKGAVWLDANKTSSYHFYQYWLNTADEDVIQYLKLFTSISDDVLEELSEATKKAPQQRAAQKRLAVELTDLIHGEAQTAAAERASRILFGEKIEDIDCSTLLDIFSDVPSTSLTAKDLEDGMTLVDLLVTAKVDKSKGAVRRLIDAGGIYINNERSSDPQLSISRSQFIEDTVLIIRSGKKKFFLIKLE